MNVFQCPAAWFYSSGADLQAGYWELDLVAGHDPCLALCCRGRRCVPRGSAWCRLFVLRIKLSAGPDLLPSFIVGPSPRGRLSLVLPGKFLAYCQRGLFWWGPWKVPPSWVLSTIQQRRPIMPDADLCFVADSLQIDFVRASRKFEIHELSCDSVMELKTWGWNKPAF